MQLPKGWRSSSLFISLRWDAIILVFTILPFVLAFFGLTDVALVMPLVLLGLVVYRLYRLRLRSLIQQTCDTCCRGGLLSQLRIRYSMRSGRTNSLDGSHSSTRSEESTSSRVSSFSSIAHCGWRRSLGRFSSCDHSLVTRVSKILASRPR